MSNCLQGLVGVRGCGSSTSEFNVNDLTGINIPDFDKAISVEKKTAYAALADIVSFATKEVVQEARTFLSANYELKSFVENDVVGYYYDNKVEVATQTGYLVGYEVRVDNVAYLDYFLHGLRLFVKNTGDVPVYVYDLIQGKLLDTITISAVSGEISSVTCDKTYSTNKQRLRLFIGYESTFESYQTAYLNPHYAMGRNERCEDVTCGTYYNNYVYFRACKIATGSAKVAENLEENTYCGGLSLNYSLQCSFTEYLCNVRNLLALPILYKAGEKIMREMKHSRRLTGVVTVYSANHDELMNDYKAEYSDKMQGVLQNMKMPESICFSCNPVVKTKVSLP